MALSVKDYTFELGKTFTTSFVNPNGKPNFVPAKIYSGLKTYNAIIPVIGDPKKGSSTFDYSKGGALATDPRLYGIIHDSNSAQERNAAIDKINSDCAQFMFRSYMRSDDGRVDTSLPEAYDYCNALLENTLENYPEFFAFGQNPNMLDMLENH